MDRLIALLPVTGETTFEQFMSDVRAAGLRGELWLRAKHSGLLQTRLADDGTLFISRSAESVG